MAGVNRTTGKATDLITFSRASGGTALRKISYGSELVTNGTFDSDLTGWSESGGSGDWSWSAGRAKDSGTGPITLNQTITTEVGKVYLISATAYNVSGGNPVLIVGGNVLYQWFSGTSELSASKAFVATSTSTIVFLSGTLATWEVDNISVKEVLFDQPDGTLTLFNHPTNIPRIEYDAAGNVKGLLIEEARTNLVTYSEDFTAVNWTKVRSSVSNGFGETSPLGNDAYKLLGTTDNNTHFIYVNVTATGDRVVSVFAKAAELSWLILANTGFGSLSASYNLSTGAVGTVTGFSSANAEAVGGGWYRCSAVVPSATADGSFDFVVALGSDDNTYVFVGATNEGIYIDGAQFEAGSFPTSYIPTSGSTATRAADIASISVDNFGYNQTNTVGTFFVDFNSFGGAVGVGNRAIAAVKGTDRAVDINANPSVPRVDVYSNHTVGALYALNGASATDNKVAAAMAQNNSAACANGNLVKVDTATGVPIIATDIHIGRYLSGSYLNGHIKSIDYYPRRLSNAQLQELTT